MKRKRDNTHIPELVRDLLVPAVDAVKSGGTVQDALDDMESEGVSSSPVTDTQAHFVGTVSEIELNRKVGGKGHDPAREPLKRQLNPNSIYCFDDDTVVAARDRMEGANLQELPVLNRNFTHIGTVNLAAIIACG